MSLLKRKLKQAFKSIRAVLADCDISGERLPLMFFSRRLSPYLARHRSWVINSRMRFFAAAFAVLLLLWIPIDYALLPQEVAGEIAVLRLLSSLFFAGLVASVTVQNRWHHSRLRLLALLLTPLLFYLAVQHIFSGAAFGAVGSILVDIYNLLPYIVVVGLAVFPLTVLESAAVGVLSLAAMVAAAFISTSFPLVHLIPAAWILLLLLGISTMAAAIQLNYMSSLIHRVSIDPLTGAFTRQSGQELLDLYFQLAVEQDEPFAVAFLDLDHFKSINDSHGHDAGDAALVGAVAALHQQLRRGDLVVRWGGEEFVVILVEADKAGVEQVMARITRHWLGQRPDGEPLTASIGVAERIGDDATEWLTLVEQADKRMYRAKQAGRARVVMDANQD